MGELAIQNIWDFFIVEPIGTIALVISLILTIVEIIRLRMETERFNPVHDISIEGLPPHTSKNNRTLIKIDNNGQRSADVDGVEIVASCFEGNIFVELDDTFIQPGETIPKWYKFPQMPSGTHTIEFIVGTEYGFISKKEVYFRIEETVTIGNS